MKKFLLGVFLSTLFFVLPAVASTRSYQYDDIDVQMTVNLDSTITVREHQVYDFAGEYHQGLRSIALKKLSAITDIKMWDGETGEELTYSPNRLDKTDPASWGKYTYYKSNNAMNVEWYYSAADEKHRWIIQYKMHGAIEFGSQYDRLYWNIFTDYDVPVRLAQANVILPVGVKSNDVQTAAYRTNEDEVEQFEDQSKLIYAFSGYNFAPYEDFTIDISWTKGVVAKAAFWQDWLGLYYGWLGVVAVALVGLIIGFIYWLFTEKFVSGRGVIVAQYEPPRGLKPALAEVILKENTTDRALSATLIDLAVRGYLQIIEEPISIFMRLAKLFALLPITIIFLIVLWIMRFDIGVLIIFVLAFLVIFSRFYTSSHSKHDYTLKLLKGFDDSLANYELHYLKILFDNGQTEFSTKKLRESSNSTKREFGVRMEKSREIILKATDNFGDFYAVNNGRGKKKFLVWFVAMVAAVVVYLFLYKFTTLYQVVPQWFYIILAIIFVAAFLYGYIKFETRLNKEGLKLKEEILGFKLYLYTAERYRLANLTPDIFEKYLPYAMIFGVEKKWSKAFIGVKLDNPAWYHSQYSSAVVVGAGMSAGSFSASAFSASFVSSFSSSFSTSSGSGSAGGGSAGGGGGGGGGGAS